MTVEHIKFIISEYEEWAKEYANDPNHKAAAGIARMELESLLLLLEELAAKVSNIDSESKDA